jgi:Peroxisomal biogenesis factor 11 (PEX11)
MGNYHTSWGTTAIIEGNKFWFCALLFSLALSVTQLLGTSTSAPSSGKKSSNTNALAKKIATDTADLLVPGSVTGWFHTGPVVVGVATVVSTILASGEVWERVMEGNGDKGKGGNGKGKGEKEKEG